MLQSNETNPYSNRRGAGGRTSASQIVFGTNPNTYTSSYSSSNSSTDLTASTRQEAPDFVADRYKKTDIFGLSQGSGDNMDSLAAAKATARRNRHPNPSTSSWSYGESTPTEYAPQYPNHHQQHQQQSREMYQAPTVDTQVAAGIPYSRGPSSVNGDDSSVRGETGGRYNDYNDNESVTSSSGIPIVNGRPYGNYSNVFSQEPEVPSARGNRRHYQASTQDTDVLNTSTAQPAYAQSYHSAKTLEQDKANHIVNIQQTRRQAQPSTQGSTFSTIFGGGEYEGSSAEPPVRFNRSTSSAGSLDGSRTSGLTSEEMNNRNAFGRSRVSRPRETSQIFF